MKLTILAIATLFLGGCLLRTTGHRHQHVDGHPAKHSHQHCHERGGKHHKLVCHDHPHGPGHH